MDLLARCDEFFQWRGDAPRAVSRALTFLTRRFSFLSLTSLAAPMLAHYPTLPWVVPHGVGMSITSGNTGIMSPKLKLPQFTALPPEQVQSDKVRHRGATLARQSGARRRH
jgi:hypothetical protein